MKERGIIMSAPMVVALLDGRKTQTRRIINPQPTDDTHGSGSWYWRKHRIDCHRWPEGMESLSPHGVAGDRLWVRETWKVTATKLEDLVQYRADGGLQEIPIGTGEIAEGFFTKNGEHGDNWRPSIFMPRWASRITLEITGVRVERLQDISVPDARREGVLCAKCQGSPHNIRVCCCKERYAALWDSLHGKGAWELNPWVWVIEFTHLASRIP